MRFSDFLDRPLGIGASVAVVGSSARLLENPLGNVIDSHDEVIRFNFAPSDRNNEFIGSRTTIRVIGMTLEDRHQENLRKIAKYENARVITKEANLHLLKGIFDEEKVFKFRDYKGVTKSALDRIAKRGLETTPQRLPPRTGLVVISILLAEIESRSGNIGLFGFDDELPTDEPWRQHYFTNKMRAGFKTDLSKKHCDPEVEISAVRFVGRLPFVRFF